MKIAIIAESGIEIKKSTKSLAELCLDRFSEVFGFTFGDMLDQVGRFGTEKVVHGAWWKN